MDIIFRDDEHQDFFYTALEHCRNKDVYHMALLYCLGVSADTRNHVWEVYDFEDDCVKTECLTEGWITSGSAKIIRLALNLYCNGTPSVSIEGDDPERQLKECRRYTVEELFCCSYARYFWQAVQIRFPEYC
ncbi:DUF6075 family protein [Lachnospiraceae bacterium JLR.KK008]